MTKKKENKKKIYISGKITGIENEAYKIFKRAEIELIRLGFNPVNPMDLNHVHDKSWSSFMKEDIKALCDCDAIFMLTNWEESRGAKIEKQIAEYLELTVMFQKRK